MSIAIAAYSQTHAVVGSDQRLFSSAYLENGQVKTLAEVASDELDKTFSLLGNRVVGAVVGTMRFSDKDTTAHLIEISESYEGKEKLEDLAEYLFDELLDRIRQIDPDEINPSGQRFEVLVCGGRDLSNRDFQIRAFEHATANPARQNRRDAYTNDWGYVTSGDDDAKEAVLKVLREKQGKLRGMGFLQLEDLAKRCINEGIANCGDQPYSCNVKSCGGVPALRFCFK